jgi:1,4-alpha-glucan branching enzyme/maltooligosyltrehalose trehalohydrolase
MTDRFRFNARFGAHLDGGAARFCLWAPDAERVELCLEGREPMAMAIADGVAEIEVPGARAGDRYRYRIDGGIEVPDPASRFQPDGVHGASELCDPTAYRWETAGWAGRPWREAVIYELHLGAFTPGGTALSAIDRLDDLVEIGITAIELMPIAAAPGMRGWGYDGVQLYAPHRAYGRPDDLKQLIDAAHARGLMVMLDVVYNHFGPDGNYLHTHAGPMFTEADTPWGSAIAVDAPDRQNVRRFLIDNALQWLIEYRFDGLRLDAVNTITADSRPTFLEQLAAEVREHTAGREVHLVLENDDNAAWLLDDRVGYRAQWNDDIHHALHRVITGESDGYYADYDPPLEMLGRCLAEGFGYQGEASAYRGGKRRGEPSACLSPQSFVAFLQNHDQVGNRAMGERIDRLAADAAVDAAVAIALLSPQIPLLFMGQEWAASTPFLFFCDHRDQGLRDAVREGRRHEFARFVAFADSAALEAIPDPNALETFEASKLDWSERDVGRHREALERTRERLRIRAAEITGRLDAIAAGTWTVDGALLEVRWPAGEGELALAWNTGDREAAVEISGRLIAGVSGGVLGPWGMAMWVSP